MFIGCLCLSGFHGRFQLFVLVADELGGRCVTCCEAVFLAIAGVFLLPFGREMVHVVELAAFAAFHLLDKFLFGIILVFCHIR